MSTDFGCEPGVHQKNRIGLLHAFKFCAPPVSHQNIHRYSATKSIFTEWKQIFSILLYSAYHYILLRTASSNVAPPEKRSSFSRAVAKLSYLLLSLSLTVIYSSAKCIINAVTLILAGPVLTASQYVCSCCHRQHCSISM